jgi:predicted nucleic acid-binding protein
MSDRRVLLDTTAWWEILQGTPAGASLRKRYVQAESQELYVSAILVAELTARLDAAGLGDDISPALAGIRARSTVLPVTDALAEEGGRLRAVLRQRDRNASLADAIMLASARSVGAKLLSNDPAFAGQPDVVTF